MALIPIDEIHKLQIRAGARGRRSGHAFEERIANFINNFEYPIKFPNILHDHLVVGDPAYHLLNYIATTYKNGEIKHAMAFSTGALATSENGKQWLKVNGISITRCKSDIIVTLRFSDEPDRTIGISTKQCNNNIPTNAQLYFTTACGFAALLSRRGIYLSDQAIEALRQFCGDSGFRPSDIPAIMGNRVVDPRRFFWEEIFHPGREELQEMFAREQDSITRLLLQKAYPDDPFPPDFLLHKTKYARLWNRTESAIYTIDELVAHSREYAGFVLKPYSVHKGSYKDPSGVKHQAPRFGIVQMQRGGQAQHPEQLQFNLEAGYFYKIGNRRPNVLRNSTGQ